ncbi:hypothetical protein BH11BAC1_BH11BAC1_28890 [soil metagenome]
MYFIQNPLTVPSDVTFLSVQGISSILVLFGITDGEITVNVLNDCGTLH